MFHKGDYYYHHKMYKEAYEVSVCEVQKILLFVSDVF